MSTEKTESRFAWFIGGAIAGLAVALYWPHEPAFAEAVDSSDKFAMCTVATQVGNPDAIFILDFVTGRLIGYAYNSSRGIFAQAYFRNIAADFNIDAGTDAQYVMVPGAVYPRPTSGASPALGGVYVGEMTSGIVWLYGFTFRNTAGPQAPQPMVPMGNVNFRQAS